MTHIPGEIKQSTGLPSVGSPKKTAAWRLFLAAALPWVITLGELLGIPSDPKNQLFFGLSASRLMLLGLAMVLILVPIVLAWIAYRQPNRFSVEQTIARPGRFFLFEMVLSSAALALWAGVFYYQNYTHPIRVVERYSAYYERIFPFLLGLFFECLVLFIGLLILQRGLHWEPLAKEKRLWQISTWICFAILALLLFMNTTGIGLEPDKAGWGSPGVPLLFYQVLLAWVAGLSVFLLQFIRPGSRFKRYPAMDLLICLVLWLAAVFFWMEQDVQRSYFSPSPVPPNEEIYPYSDAGYYDYNAQSLLLGYGFMNGQVVPRPLYILMLAGFHAIAGQGYEQTIFIQTLVLALLPVLLYLLGKELHSPALGLALGILVIVREVNSIVATPWVEVSHSKLYMADLPTTLAVIALAWLTVRWFKDRPASWSRGLLVGGGLGVAALLRTQALLLLPAILFAAAWLYWKNWKQLINAGLAILLGLGLVLSPWLIRNWQKTGRLVFDDPVTQNALVAQRYSFDEQAMPLRQTGESEEAYAQRLSADIRQFLLANPTVVARFVSGHFINNLVSTALVLPTQFSIDQSCNTSRVCEPFWISLIGKMSPGSQVLLVLNLLVVAFGLAASWRRWKVAGLIPVLFLLAYSLSNAVARNSARRYILPVDWVGYFYLLIGALEIAGWAAILFGARTDIMNIGIAPEPGKSKSFTWSKEWIRIALAAVCLLAIGLSLPLAELLGSPEFTPSSKADLVQQLVDDPTTASLSISPEGLESFASQEQVVALQGRAFYPRFYPPMEGEPGSGWPAYKPYEYRATPKLGFILVGPAGTTQLNLALDEIPEQFPNASDVFILGCQENGYVDVLLVKFFGNDQTLIRTKIDSLACPLR